MVLLWEKAVEQVLEVVPVAAQAVLLNPELLCQDLVLV
jgi:hypothetical protein